MYHRRVWRLYDVVRSECNYCNGEMGRSVSVCHLLRIARRGKGGSMQRREKDRCGISKHYSRVMRQWILTSEALYFVRSHCTTSGEAVWHTRKFDLDIFYYIPSFFFLFWLRADFGSLRFFLSFFIIIFFFPVVSSRGLLLSRPAFPRPTYYTRASREAKKSQALQSSRARRPSVSQRNREM